MNTPKIKTLELTIVSALRHPFLKDSRIHFAFEKMLEHFKNEDFLYGQQHVAAIKEIYTNRNYSGANLDYVAKSLGLDFKRFLENRKNYLRLFAQKFLGLDVNGKKIFFLLYEALKKEHALADRLCSSA